MEHELKRIAPLRAANVTAAVYGLMLTAFALLFFPFLLIALLLGSQQTSEFGGPLFALFLLILYPIMGVVMGWISGLLGSAVYNLVVRWTGGVLFELSVVAPETHGAIIAQD